MIGGKAVALAIKVTSDARSASAGLDAATGKVSKLGKAGSIAGKLLVAGLAAGAAAAIKFAGLAAQDQQEQAKLANALRTSTGARSKDIASVEKWITAQGRALGVSDDDLRPSLSALATATGSVRKAQELASIAMDVSTRRGVSLQSVSNKLAKAYATGNAAALATYGVQTKVGDQTRSLDAVTRDLAKTYEGSASRAANTAAGKYQRAKLRFSELGETIGYKLIPVMLTLANAGIKVADWIERNQTAAGILIGTLGGLLAITWGVSKAVQAWAAISKVAAAAQTVLNIALAANPVVLIVVAVIALGVALVVAYKKSETFRRIVDGVFRGIGRVVAWVVGFIRAHWKTILTILIGPIAIAVRLIYKYRDKITGAFFGALAWVRSNWKTILAFLTGPIGLAVLAISRNWDKITSGFQKVRDRLGDAAATAKRLVVDAFEAMWSPVQKLIDLVQRVIDLIRSIPKPSIDIPFVGKALAGGGSDGRTAATGGRTQVDVRVGFDEQSFLRARSARARIFGGGGQVTVSLV